MKKTIIFILALLLIFSLVFSVYAKVAKKAKWNSYTADKLPKEAGWYDGGVSTVEVMDDPDIAGNKILKFIGGEKGAQWKYDIAPVSAITIIFRAKAIDPSIFSWDVDWRAQNGRERIMFKSSVIDFNKGGKLIDMADDGKWHIWRVTMEFKGGKVITNLYKDDDPTSIEKDVVSDAKDSGNTIRFGDGSGTDTFSAYYDWFIWTTSGVYNPTDLPISKIAAELKLTGVK